MPSEVPPDKPNKDIDTQEPETVTINDQAIVVILIILLGFVVLLSSGLVLLSPQTDLIDQITCQSHVVKPDRKLPETVKKVGYIQLGNDTRNVVVDCEKLSIKENL
jgi:hypothetical protein